MTERKFTDERLLEAIKEHQTEAAAAEALCVPIYIVFNRLRTIKLRQRVQAAYARRLNANSASIKHDSSRRIADREFTDEQLLDALNKYRTKAAAARALGVTRQAVDWRIKRAGIMRVDPAPKLWKFPDSTP